MRITEGHLARHYQGRGGSRGPALLDIAQDHALITTDPDHKSPHPPGPDAKHGPIQTPLDVNLSYNSLR